MFEVRRAAPVAQQRARPPARANTKAANARSVVT